MRFLRSNISRRTFMMDKHAARERISRVDLPGEIKTNHTILSRCLPNARAYLNCARIKQHFGLFPFFQIISSQIFIVNALNIVFYGTKTILFRHLFLCNCITIHYFTILKSKTDPISKSFYKHERFGIRSQTTVAN